LATPPLKQELPSGVTQHSREAVIDGGRFKLSHEPFRSSRNGGLKKFSKFLQGPLHWRMGFHLTNLILIAGGLFNRFHPNEVENARVGCEFTAPTSLCWSPTASMPSAMDWGGISRVGGVSRRKRKRAPPEVRAVPFPAQFASTHSR